MHRLHPATILLEGLNFVRHFGWSLILLIFARPKGGSSAMADVFFTAMFGGVGVLAILYAVFRYLTMTYAIEGGAFVVRKGLIWKQVRTIPLERIQNVNLKRTLVHRLFRVTTLDIETAAGAGAEASLAVLSQDLADHLRHQLLGNVDVPFQVAEELPKVHYQATLRELFLAGAFQNRLLYLLVALAGLFQFDEIIIDNLGSLDWVSRSIVLMPTSLAAWAIAMLALVGLVIGWVASIVATTVKYYGFTVWPHARGLRVHYGLLTQVENVVPVDRILSVAIGQPLLYRPFRFYEVMVQSAGSFGEKENAGSAKLAPILLHNDLDRIVRLAFPKVDLGSFRYQKVSPKSVWRHLISSALSLAILEGSFFFGRAAFAKMVALPIHLAWIGGLTYAGLSVWFAVRSYHTTGYAIANGFIASRQGIFRRDLTIAPLECAQMIAVKQGFFQRRWGLADVTMATANGAVTVANLELADSRTLEREILAGTGTGFGIGGV